MAGFEVTLHGRFWVTPEVTQAYEIHSQGVRIICFVIMDAILAAHFTSGGLSQS
jgi:hypothetical protein